MDRVHVARVLGRPDRSFFLFGPRGVGKSTWLRDVLADGVWFDLLDASLYLELAQRPHDLEVLIGQRPAEAWVVIDEIQKVPELLDEVHRLIENRGWRFALAGSSARKLRRQGTNLLGGRALTRQLESFCWKELGADFELDSALRWGLLPGVCLDQARAADLLDAYVNTYLKEEIKEEGIVRRVPPFLRFLSVAGQINGQQVNAANLAREAAVPRSSVDGYFSILEDTLLGRFLPAYRPQAKVREQAHPKFYWFDPGVARAAAGLLRDPADRLWLGCALETLVYHELRVYNQVSERHRLIAFYRTESGAEIDFVIETQKRRPEMPPHLVGVEVKLAEHWDRKWEQPMRSLKANGTVVVERMFGVYVGPRAYDFGDLEVLPVGDFFKKLYAGGVF